MARVSVWNRLRSGHHAAEADIVGFFVGPEPVNRGGSEGLESKSLLIIKSPATQRFLLTARTVEAPLPHIAEHVVQAEAIRWKSAHEFGQFPLFLLARSRLLEGRVGYECVPLNLAGQVIDKAGWQ